MYLMRDSEIMANSGCCNPSRKQLVLARAWGTRSPALLTGTHAGVVQPLWATVWQCLET